MRGEIDELSTSMSSIVIGSSSRSLVDLSWIDLPKDAEGSAGADKEQKEEKGVKIDDSIIVPVWIEGNMAKHSENTIKVAMEIKDAKIGESSENSGQQIACKVFPVERYPVSEDQLDGIEERCRGYRGVFFLWDRKESEEEIYTKNAAAVKDFAKTGNIGWTEKLHHIQASLLEISLRSSVSFICISKETIGEAAESLKNSQRSSQGSAGVKMKKKTEPEDVLRNILGTVGGILQKEVEILGTKYKTTAALVQSVPLGSVEGVRSKTLDKINDLFR